MMFVVLMREMRESADSPPQPVQNWRTSLFENMLKYTFLWCIIRKIYVFKTLPTEGLKHSLYKIWGLLRVLNTACTKYGLAEPKEVVCGGTRDKACHRDGWPCLLL